METEFEACTQYNDYKGTAAADGYDGPVSNEEYEKIGVRLEKGESVMGIHISFGEIMRPHTPNNVRIYADFLIDCDDVKPKINPVRLRKRCIEFQNVEDFFRIFKRFDVTLSFKGALEGKTCFIEENPPE